jgi:hypothetical protein
MKGDGMDRERMRAYGHMQQLGGVRLVTLEDGAERGVRVLELRTTTGLELGIVVDRGFDVGWCRHNGRSIAWHSPTGFAGPWYREPAGLGFLRNFPGGLFVTCGLDHILFPESDPQDTYNYPGRTETEYGLHGRVSHTPAVVRTYGERWEDGRCVLFAEGEVRQAGALAETLVLRRRVEVDLDGLEIRWRDEVSNEGHLPGPHMLLYHMNLGAPLVGPASRLHAPVRGVRFATPTATGEPGEHLEFPPPRADFAEQAFSHDMACDVDGTVPVAVTNHDDPANPWGVLLRYDGARFPYFLQWRYFAAGTYVLGLEPSTNGITGRAGARADNELTILEPGESRVYENRLELLAGAERCKGAEATVARLLDRETVA